MAPLQTAGQPSFGRRPASTSMRYPMSATETATGAFEAELLAILPKLRAMAVMFARDRTLADDLLQDAIALALAGQNRYVLGTNLAAWMYRLMRNRFISILRQHKVPMIPLEDPAA